MSPLHIGQQYTPGHYVTPITQRGITAPNGYREPNDRQLIDNVVTANILDTSQQIQNAVNSTNARSLWFSPAEMALPSSTGYNVTKVVFRAPPILTEAIVPTQHIYYNSDAHEFCLPLSINHANVPHINYPYDALKVPSRASSAVNSSSVHLNQQGHKMLNHSHDSVSQLSTDLFNEQNDSKTMEVSDQPHLTSDDSADSSDADVSTHIQLFNQNNDVVYDNALQPVDDSPGDGELVQQPALIIPLSAIAGLEFTLSLDSASAAPAQLTIALRHDTPQQSRIQTTHCDSVNTSVSSLTAQLQRTPPSKYRAVRAFNSLRATWRTGVHEYQHKPYLKQLPPICFTAVTYPAITTTLITMIVCFIMHIWLLGIVCCILCSGLICLHMYRVRNMYYLESNLDQQREQCYYITFYFVLEQLMDFVYLRQFMLAANTKSAHTTVHNTGSKQSTAVRFSQMPLFLDNVYVDYTCRLLLPPVAYHSPRLRRISRLILPLLYLYQAFDALFSSLLPSLFNVFLSIMPYCRAEWLAVLNIITTLLQPFVTLLQYTLLPQITVIITSLATLSRRAIIVLQAVIVPIRYIQASLYWFGAGITSMLAPLLQLTDVFKSIFQSILHPMHTLTNTFNKTVMAINAIVAPIITVIAQSATVLIELLANAGCVLLTPFQAIYIVISQSVLPRVSQSLTTMATASLQAKSAAQTTNNASSGFSKFSKSVGVRIVRVAVAMSNRFVMFFNKGKAQYNERQHQAHLQAELKKTQLQQQLYLNRVELQQALVAAGHGNAMKSLSTSPTHSSVNDANRRRSLPLQALPNDLRQRRLQGRKNANLSFDITGLQTNFEQLLSPVDDSDSVNSNDIQQEFERLNEHKMSHLNTHDVHTPMSASLPSTPTSAFTRQSLRHRTRDNTAHLRSHSLSNRSLSPARLHSIARHAMPTSPSPLPSSRRNTQYNTLFHTMQTDSTPVSPSHSPTLTHTRSHTSISSLPDRDGEFIRPYGMVKKTSPSSRSTPALHITNSPSISAKSHAAMLSPVADMDLPEAVTDHTTATTNSSESEWSRVNSERSDSSDASDTNHT